MRSCETLPLSDKKALWTRTRSIAYEATKSSQVQTADVSGNP